MHPIAAAVLLLFMLRWLAQLGLEWLNRSEVRAHASAVPEPFREIIDAPTYERAVAYTLTRNRYACMEMTFSTALLIAVLFSGVLPWYWEAWTATAGTGVWASAAGLFLLGVVLAIPNLPWEWWFQFRIEERFGFNTSTQATWWMDRVKSLLIGAVLLVPLLALLFRLVEL